MLFVDNESSNMTTTPPRRILIAGASGFVGSALIPALEANGWDVTQLVRSEPKNAGQIQWDPGNHRIPEDALAGIDVVINLAGASIAGGWWTKARKHLIRQSRIDATKTLSDAIAKAPSKPAVFINTSAIGYYGSRPGEILTEDSASGEGFLAEVCVEWEAAAEAARDAGVRVVHPRFGLVMDGSAGMLPVIKLPFKFGLGGKIGGDQYMGWIDLHDLVRIFPFLIDHEHIDGPVNAVAPNAITNAEFTRAMGKALNRPAVIPVPKKVAATIGGELVQDLLLADQHVVPNVLLDAGFEFERPDIDQSLKHAFK